MNSPIRQFRMLTVLKHYPRTLSFQIIFPVLIVTLPFLPALTRVIAHSPRTIRRQRSEGADQNPAGLSEGVSVRVAGQRDARINLSDGREVLTSYAGPEEQQQAL